MDSESIKKILEFILPKEHITSPSLQREFKIGYNQAVDIIDELKRLRLIYKAPHIPRIYSPGMYIVKTKKVKGYIRRINRFKPRIIGYFFSIIRNFLYRS